MPGPFVDALDALGPIIWWACTDPSGPTVTDIAGSLDGTAMNTPLAGGASGNMPTFGQPGIGGSDGSILFDGSRASRIQATFTGGDTMLEFSVFVLVRFHSWNPVNAAFGERWNAIFEMGEYNFLAMQGPGDSTDQTLGKAGGGNLGGSGEAHTIDTLERTYLVGWTFSNIDNTARLYLDCDEIANTFVSGAVTGGHTSEALRLNYVFGDDRCSNASCSDFVLFDRALTADEICTLTDLVGVPTPPELGAWPDSVGIVLDVTGNNVADGTAPTWTDITDDVESWSTQRGRSFELDRVETGTASATLHNLDSEWDPTNASSPYYPNLRPMRPFRIGASWDSVDYYIFTGYVERFPQAWDDHGLQGQTGLAAVDASYALAQIICYSVLYKEITDLDLISYYPMLEAQDKKQARDITGTNGPLTRQRTGGHIAFGTSFLPGTTGGGLAFSDQDNGTSEGVRLALSPVTTSFDPVAESGASIGIWVLCGRDAKSTTIFMQDAVSGGSRCRIRLYIDASGHAVASITADSGGTDVATVTGPVITDGDPHFLLATVNSVGKHLELFVDNTSAGTASTTAALATGLTADWYLGDDGTGTQYFTGSVAHFFLTNGVMGGGGITQVMEAGTNVYAGVESLGPRLTRLMTLPEPNIDLPTDFDPGTNLIGPADQVNGENFYDVAREAAEMDGAVFFVAGDGTLTERQTNPTPTPLYVFGEDVAGGEIPYEGDIVFDYDDTYIKNDVTVVNSDGFTIRRQSGASQNLYWRRAHQAQTNYYNDNNTTDMADRLLAVYKDPHYRVAQMTVRPSRIGNAVAGAWPACLGLDIGDCVTVNRRPPSGAEISADFYVLNIAHNVMPGDWATTFVLAPVVDWTT